MHIGGISSKTFSYRLLEILPGFVTWMTFIAAVVFSILQPAIVAFFIILFDLYWLMKAINISFHLLYTYKRINLHSTIDWMARCQALVGVKSLRLDLESKLDNAKGVLKWDTREEISRLKELESRFNSLDYKKIYHIILLPTVDESEKVLSASIDSYLACHYPKDRMVLVLAFESRSGDYAALTAKNLSENYISQFSKLLTTFHPDALPGEARTKGANITYAAKQVKLWIDESGLAYENVVVSAFDSDTVVRTDYFAQLTYAYLTAKDPVHTSYQPIPLYNNNVWDAPAANRLVAVNSSFWQMVESSRHDRLVTFSSHSMSFQALVEVDFWPVDVISEDSQIFWRCFLHYQGHYQTQPLFTTISLDAVALDSYWKSLIGQYKQNRRWAWGVVDFPYVVYGFAKDKVIPLWKKILYGYRLFEGHYFWATAAPIIAVLGWLPLMLGQEKIQNRVFAANLPQVTGTIMTVSTLFLIFFVGLYVNLLPKRPASRSPWRALGMVLQWALVPVSSIVFGAIPAIDAQTRLMLGKYMEFWVTPKIRRDNGGKLDALDSPLKSEEFK